MGLVGHKKSKLILFYVFWVVGFQFNVSLPPIEMIDFFYHPKKSVKASMSHG